MNIAIGSYRNPRDREAKIDAYKKLLQAQINLGKLTEQAFKDKLARGDAPYVPTPLERSQYSTQSEFLSDLNEQERVAIQKTKELLPFGTEARTFVLDMLRPRESVIDPRSPSVASTTLPRVVLYNQYFDRFVKEQLKGISRLSSASLLRAWFEFIDSLTADLLPKQGVIDAIKNTIQRMITRLAPDPAERKEADGLLAILDERVLSEGQLSMMKSTLEQTPTFEAIQQLRKTLQPTTKPSSRIPIVPAIVVSPPVGAPPRPPVGRKTRRK